MNRRPYAVAAALAGVLALVLAAGAAASVANSVPPPDATSMALAATDFQPGAKVARDETITSGGYQLYIRLFKPGLRIGKQRLLSAVSEVITFASADSAAQNFASSRKAFQSKSGRKTVAKQFAQEFVLGAGNKLKVSKTVVGPPKTLGPSSLRLPIALTTSSGRLSMAIDVVVVDRVMSIVILAGLFDSKVANADAARAAAAALEHMRAALTVANVEPPTISGTVAQGAALTVDEGSWTGAPSSFTYAWQRCDTTGATCTPIDGATTGTYTPSAADSGFALRVVVTGSNTVGSQDATSTPTAPVA